MTRIDFYILQKNSEEARLEFAARLCEKAYRQDMSVMIITPNTTTAPKMDTMLWGFKPESFIPHIEINATTQNNTATVEAVLISSGKDEPSHHGLLINLGFTIPDMFSRFQRVAEVVVQTPETLEATRNHFSFYRKRGYPVAPHNIN